MAKRGEVHARQGITADGDATTVVRSDNHTLIDVASAEKMKQTLNLVDQLTKLNALQLQNSGDQIAALVSQKRSLIRDDDIDPAEIEKEISRLSRYRLTELQEQGALLETIEKGLYPALAGLIGMQVATDGNEQELIDSEQQLQHVSRTRSFVQKIVNLVKPTRGNLREEYQSPDLII